MATIPETIINVVTVDGVKLNLSAGDTLAVMVPHVISADQHMYLIEAFKHAAPDVKVVVLDGGITIAAISKN